MHLALVPAESGLGLAGHARPAEQLLDLAGERDLQVCVTVLNGWLSGFDFCPA
ncbi:hypothetical protein [Ruania halotolerans]|uniref:hypothetical protein n=1 Tax=Ruania halotolerans TaxID=2897773 RepID=UPI001E5AA3B7|nr:hypothetical protein [Ruania halotolerans]UFU06151.1 hypothetical protein LQF10_17250 [Ruania halotolerans]